MALILLTFVSLLLSKSGLSELQRDNNTPMSSSHRIDRTELKITDLNADVLYLIFSHLDVEDLLNTVEAFPEYCHLIRRIFGQKYSTYKLEIKKQPFNTFEPELRTVFPTEKRFDVYGIDDFDLNVIKVFGDVFQKIKIDYSQGVSYLRRKTVSKVLNEYCSENLKRLELRSIEQFVLNQFTVPFKGVEEFTCFINTQCLNSTQLLNQLFPNLRRLNLKLHSDSDYSFIDCELPHLEHLTLTVSRDAWKRRDQIEGFVQKNANIQSVELVGKAFPRNYIEVIKQLLPNIEHLTIPSVNIEFDSIHFGNVKSFDFVEITLDSIGKLSLPNLQSLRMVYELNSFDRWQEFFQRHTNITHLNFQQAFSRVPSGIIPLNELFDDSRNLSDVNFECICHIPVENIITFIENHGNLQKIRFSFKEFTENDERIIRERFESEWHIKNIDQYYDFNVMKGFCLERE